MEERPKKMAKRGLLHGHVIYLCYSARRNIIANKINRMGGTLTDDINHPQLSTLLAENKANIPKLPTNTQADCVSYDWIAKSTDRKLKEKLDFLIDKVQTTPSHQTSIMDTFARVEKPASDFNYNLSQHGTLITIFPDEAKLERHKLAAFDLDSTIICTKSGRVFAKGPNDWKFLYKKSLMIEKFNELREQGFELVIFSNQKGISTGKSTPDEFFTKISGITSHISHPVHVYAATEDDEFRKPKTGMWDYLVSEIDFDIDVENSFYVGDAAGRPAGWKSGVKRDHSCSDRKFALNVGIKFYTPEEFFLEEKEATYSLGFDPREFSLSENASSIDGSVFENLEEPEMVIFVGLPGSGKSFTFKQELEPRGFVHINQDILKSLSACKKVAKAALLEGKSIAIDSTNVSVSKRSAWIEFGEKHGAKRIRCIWMDVDRKIAEHLNWYRERRGERKHVSRVVYNTMAKKFSPPTVDEGFDDVVICNFHPKFETDEDQANFLTFQ